MRTVRLAGAAALALALSASVALARPFTVDDLLGQATFGAAAFDPSGRWLVYEAHGPYDRGRRFDQGAWNGRALSRLEVVDLRAGGAMRPRRLGPARAVVAGPFAPSGGRLAVFRLNGHRFGLGVADLRRRVVRWFDVTPLQADRGRTVAWLSDHELLVLARTDRQAPEDARRGWVAAERLPALWSAAAAGRSAHVVLGSGAYLGVRTRPAPVRLLRLDVGSGASTILAEGPFVDVEVSPDGRRVALLRTGADRQAIGDAPVRGVAGAETEAHALEILDLASGALRSPCPACDLLPQVLSWSPDGAQLLVFARRPGELWTEGRLRLVDAATGASREVGEGVTPHLDLNPVRAWIDWMGPEPLVFGRLAGAGGGRDDWFRLSRAGAVNLTRALPPPDKMLRLADAATFEVAAGGGLWTVDPDGGQPRRLAAAVRPALAVDPETATGRPGRGPFRRAWLRLGGDAAAPVAWATPKGLQTAAIAASAELMDALSADGRAAIRREVSAAGVQRLWLVRAGRPPRLVDELNAGQADTEAPEVVAVRHAGPVGQPLTSWLYLPRRPQGVPPLLVRPYLGASFAEPVVDRAADQGFMINLRVLTSHGYAVLIPSLPNPPGGMTDPAAGLADRILGVVAAAERTPGARGRFDPQRLGLIGFSFGGYSVMTTLTQTNRFRAAVSIAGVSDFVSYWASQSPFAYLDPASGYVGNRMTGLVEVTQPRLTAPPWRDPERYARNSPLLAADRIETPLLLFHGALDPIPHAGSEAMYSALFRQGKDAMLVTYWGAMHGLSSPGDVRDMYARIFAFFDARLASGAPPPVNLEPGSASGGPRPPSPAPR